MQRRAAVVAVAASRARGGARVNTRGNTNALEQRKARPVAKNERVFTAFGNGVRQSLCVVLLQRNHSYQRR